MSQVEEDSFLRRDSLNVLIKSQYWVGAIALLVLLHFPYWVPENSLVRWIGLVVWMEIYVLIIAFMAGCPTKRMITFTRKKLGMKKIFVAALSGVLIMFIGFGVVLLKEPSLTNHMPPILIILLCIYLGVNAGVHFATIIFPKALLTTYMLGVYGEGENNRVTRAMGESMVTFVKKFPPFRWYAEEGGSSQSVLVLACSFTFETLLIYYRMPAVAVFLFSFIHFVMVLIFVGYTISIFI